ncbi:FAD-binding protein [Bradyrhizobium lupini]|uniref:FAD-binding protein n=1 Tax=Rhizobium lupini TaxID=136996 RepID=UPI003673403B
MGLSLSHRWPGQVAAYVAAGVEYMRLMRKWTKQAGVTILDHSHALELIVDDNGAVAGASRLRRQKHDRWTVRAEAVAIATGGCALLSKILGSNVLTGDGYLMAAQVGAEFSSMECSNPYVISRAFGSVTKTLFYRWATFTAVLSPVRRRRVGAWPSPARCSRARSMRRSIRLTMTYSARCFLPFDRAGIDPFRDRFPIVLRLEGTVRGTGGFASLTTVVRPTGALCRRQRSDARVDLRRFYRWRQPQCHLGRIVGKLGGGGRCRLRQAAWYDH